VSVQYKLGPIGVVVGYGNWLAYTTSIQVATYAICTCTKWPYDC